MADLALTVAAVLFLAVTAVVLIAALLPRAKYLTNKNAGNLPSAFRRDSPRFREF